MAKELTSGSIYSPETDTYMAEYPGVKPTRLYPPPDLLMPHQTGQPPPTRSRVLALTFMDLGQYTVVCREGLTLQTLIPLRAILARGAAILVPLPALHLEQKRGIRHPVLTDPDLHLSAGDARGLAAVDVVAGGAGGGALITRATGCDCAGHLGHHELARGEGASHGNKEGENGGT